MAICLYCNDPEGNHKVGCPKEMSTAVYRARAKRRWNDGYDHGLHRPTLDVISNDPTFLLGHQAGLISGIITQEEGP